MQTYNTVSFNGSGQAQITTITRPKIRANILYEGVEVDTDYVQTTVSEANRYVKLSQLYDGVSNVNKYFILEHGNNLLNGTCTVAGENSQVGWIGSQLSSADGWFTSPPVITFTLPFSYAFYRVYFAFWRDEYATEFTVNLYLADELVSTETIMNNTSDITVVDFNGVIADKMEIVISRWSVGGRVAKLSEAWVRYEETYDEDMLLNVSMLSEVDEENPYLPKSSEVVLTLFNDGRWDVGTALHELARPQRIVKLYYVYEDGKDELVFVGHTEKFDTQKNIVQILAHDSWAFLVEEDGDFPITENVNIKSAFDTLLNKVKIPLFMYENNCDSNKTMSFYWNNASVRWGLTKLATCNNVKLRMRKGKLIVGANEVARHFVTDDEVIDAKVDRNLNLYTRITVKSSDFKRQIRTYTANVSVEANQEVMLSIEHGRLFNSPNYSMSNNNISVKAVKRYVDHDEVTLKNSTSNKQDGVLSVQFDELAMSETIYRFEHSMIKLFGRHGTEVSDFEFFTENSAREYAMERFKYRQEEAEIKLPFFPDIEPDDLLDYAGFTFEVLSVKHEMNSANLITTLRCRALIS